jgi:hypothetical protein
VGNTAESLGSFRSLRSIRAAAIQKVTWSGNVIRGAVELSQPSASVPLGESVASLKRIRQARVWSFHNLSLRVPRWPGIAVEYTDRKIVAVLVLRPSFVRSRHHANCFGRSNGALVFRLTRTASFAEQLTWIRCDQSPAVSIASVCC